MAWVDGIAGAYDFKFYFVETDYLLQYQAPGADIFGGYSPPVSMLTNIWLGENNTINFKIKDTLTESQS
jgi:hypothetical protein